MKTRFPIIISLCVLALAFFIKREDFPFVRELRLQVFDSYIRHHPRAYTPQPVRIIDFDEESIRRIGQWPWPRTKLAELVDKLNIMGASAIAWDVVFSEPDRTSPEAVFANWGREKEFREMAGQLPNHDKVFAEALESSNSITSFVPMNESYPVLPASKAGFSFGGDDPKPHLRAFDGALSTLPALEKAAKGNGAINPSAEDSIIRSIPLVTLIGGQFYPSLSAEALRVAQGASTYIIKSAGASGEQAFGAHTGITGVKVGKFEMPTDSKGNLWVYYTNPVPERYIPAWKVFESDFNPSLVEGNILLLGTSAAGLKDIRATPMSSVTNGVEVHAQAIEQALTGEYLKRPDWVTGTEDVTLVFTGLVLIYMLAHFSALAGVAFTVIALGIAGMASWRAFLDYHLLIDPVTPGIAIVLIYLVGSLSKYLSGEREKKHIKQAFTQYMSPELVGQLSKNPEKLKLGGEMKELTLLFSDIRGFTGLSETMDAQQLTHFINKFLTPMSNVIMGSKGTIDKYMGDCIMAFWNAPLDDPDHARHAADAALGMLGELKKLNKGKKKPVQIGIGLNTGRVCVGNMGSDQRFDYSVLGDDVNLASRLEGQSSTYGVPILIGEATARQLGDDYATLEVDTIRVKGKKQAVKVYALLGGKEVANDPGFHHFRKAFLGMLESYRKRGWADAGKKIAKCRKLNNLMPGDMSGLVKLYAARIAQYKKKPPAKGWDGVHDAMTK